MPTTLLIEQEDLQNKINVVEEFIYLVALITNKGGCGAETRRLTRISIARTASLFCQLSFHLLGGRPGGLLFNFWRCL